MLVATVFGGSPACLDLDESERNAPPGINRTLTVAGIAYQRGDAQAIERKIQHLKESLGLGSDDEIKYNPDSSHPSLIKAVKAGNDRKLVRIRSLERIAMWPVHVIGHVELFGHGSNAEARVGRYLASFRETALTFASALDRAPRSSHHQIRIDYPSHDVGQDPFREYQRICRERLHTLGFAPSLSSSPASVSPFLQIADIVVGCVSEYVTDKARSLVRASGYRPRPWSAENFQLIARKAFLPTGSFGVTVHTDSEDLAQQLQEAIMLDSILADGTGDPITPIRVLSRPSMRHIEVTEPSQSMRSRGSNRQAG